MYSNSEYPVAHLPPQLNNIAQAISDRTQAPIELIIGTCLGAMSLASQALVTFQYRDGRISPPSLYSVILAESGERKTAVSNLVMKPILEFEKQALKTYFDEINVYEADSQAWKSVNKSILNQIRKKEDQSENYSYDQERLREHYLEKPKAPKLPKLIYNDTTHEAIVKGLSENIGSAGLISDEGGSVLNGRAINNLPLFNQLWDGAPYTVERKDHREIIDESRFIILVLTQRNELNNFIKTRGERAIGNGFFARCLWSSTTTTQGRRQQLADVSYDDRNLDKFHERISELLVLTQNKSPVRVLRFSSEAEKRFSVFLNNIETQILSDKNKHPALMGILSKIPENVVRLSTLIHFFFEFEGDEINLGTLEHITKVIHYYYNQALTILTERADKGEDDAKKLYQWLLHGPINERGTCYRVAKTHVRRYAPYQLRDGARLNKALKILEEYGNITISKEHNTNGSIHQIIVINRS